MSTYALKDVWDAAAGQGYEPSISKDGQLTLGFVLLSICMFGIPLITDSGAD